MLYICKILDFSPYIFGGSLPKKKNSSAKKRFTNPFIFNEEKMWYIHLWMLKKRGIMFSNASYRLIHCTSLYCVWFLIHFYKNVKSESTILISIFCKKNVVHPLHLHFWGRFTTEKVYNPFIFNEEKM